MPAILALMPANVAISRTKPDAQRASRQKRAERSHALA